MKKLIICLAAAFAGFSGQAQAPDTPDTTAKKQPVDIYHGINAGISFNPYLYGDYGFFNDGPGTPAAPVLGYFLDVHMRGRTWLFMQFNFAWTRVKNTYYQGAQTHTSIDDFVDLNVPIRFGFRLGKEDAKFTFFPTAGFGVYFPVMGVERAKINGNSTYTSEAIWFNSYDDVPLYPLLNIGFEAKWRFSQRNNLAIGFNSNYLVAENSFYIKFGWNKYKKEKKKAE